MREVVSKKGRYTSRQKNLGANLQDVRTGFIFCVFQGNEGMLETRVRAAGKAIYAQERERETTSPPPHCTTRFELAFVILNSPKIDGYSASLFQVVHVTFFLLHLKECCTLRKDSSLTDT